MLKRLFTLNRQDWIGLAYWFLVSAVIGLFAILVMVAREIYQCKYYHLARFEWKDVVKYSLVIVLGSVANYWILDLLL